MPNSFKSVAYTTTGSGSNEDVYTCNVVASVIKSLSVYNNNGSNAYAATVKLYKASTSTSYEINYQSISARTAWSVMPSDGSINLENGDKIQVVTTQAGLVVSLAFLESSTTVSGTNLSDIEDVSTVPATDGQVFTWDSATGLATWETLPLSAVQGTAPITVTGTTTRTVAISAATTSAAGSMSSADKTKLDGIATGAEVNQNTFSNVAVAGQTTIEADGKTDTLTLVAGTNITITTDAGADSVTISASGGAAGVTSVTGTAPIVSSGGTTPAISISAATTSTAGSMSSADKTKLDGIESGAQVNDVTSVNTQVGAVVLDADDIDDSTTAHKFTTAADISKLAGIASGAEVNQNSFSNIAVSGQTTVAADEKTDTVTFAQAGGVTITTNATTDTVTVSSRTLDDNDVTLSDIRIIDVNDNGLSIVDGATPVADLGGTAQSFYRDLRVFGGTNAGVIRVFEASSNGNNSVSIQAPSLLGANVTFTLPSSDGSAYQVMQTNGSGGLSFVTKQVTQITGKTVATGAWSLVGGVYEASISDGAILSTSIVDVIPDNGSASTVRTAQVLPRTDSSTGSVKIYSTSLPGATITVTLNIFDL